MDATLKKVWLFCRELGLACAAALQFLTIVKPIVKRSFSAKELGQAVGCFPIVGLLLGLVLALLDLVLTRIWHGNMLHVAILLAVWTMLTGALHLDGLLDCFDGLFGGKTPEERLDIMRDPHVGSFAVIGGVLLLLLKFSALAAVRIEALILAPVLARWCLSWAVIGFPYARTEGLGRVMKDNADWPDLCLATMVAGLTTAVTAFYAGPLVLLFMPAAFVASWLLAKWVMTRIPGLTGDIYGAICELMEVLVMMLMAL